MIYLDTSALIKLYIQEPGSAEVQALLASQSYPTHTPALGCRTLDILHVAAAVLLKVGLFMTFDQPQAQLATLAGLTVHPV